MTRSPEVAAAMEREEIKEERKKKRLGRTVIH
jgi:hypothetical protein